MAEHEHEGTAEQVIRRKDELKSDRSSWEEWWKLISDRVMPSYSFLQDTTPGKHRRMNIWDSTATQAVVSASDAIHGLLVNPAIEWFNIKLHGVTGMEEWEHGVTGWALSVLNDPDVGFSSAMHESFAVQLAFGTGPYQVKESHERIRFKSHPLNDIYFLWDDDDDIVETCRCFELTAAEIFSRWGDNASEDTRKKADDPKKRYDKVEITHQVISRKFDDPKKGGQGFASRYVEDKKKTLLSKGGFRLNPYLAPRLSKSPNQMYGQSPAMDVMPAIMTANTIVKDTLMAAQMQTRPPMIAAANTLTAKLNTSPGAINYLKNGGGLAAKPEPIVTGSRADVGMAVLEIQREIIRVAYRLDTFTLPPPGKQDRMSATEVIERRQDGLLQTSPMVSRQYGESLSPSVKRVVHWGLRTGRIPIPNISVEARTMAEGFDKLVDMIDIDYVSPMAMAQKASKVQVFGQAMIAATPILQADPTVFSTTIPGEEAVVAIMKAMNVSPEFYNSLEIALANREKMQQQQETQGQLQSAETGAGALRLAGAGIKDLAVAGAA